MIRVKRSALSSYASGLLAAGRGVFSADEAQKELGISRGALLDAAERLQRHGQLIRPRRGFYVIVPPQHATAGAPPPAWYIDPLMRHERRPYYAGLLTAAAAHGASHQAVMEFQVITNKLLSDIEAGRTRIVFSYRKDIPNGCNRKNSPPCRTSSRKRSCNALGICSEGWGSRRLRSQCSWNCRRAGHWRGSNSSPNRRAIPICRHRLPNAMHAGALSSVDHRRSTSDPAGLHHRVEPRRAMSKPTAGRARHHQPRPCRHLLRSAY